jgi:uncharacterized protein (TIGR03066 family)
MRGILMACAVVALCVSAGHADDKKVDPAKIVGKWKLIRTTAENAPKEAMIEFLKDNKLLVVANPGGTSIEIHGVYKMESNKLTVTLFLPDGKKDTPETDTIKSLTDDKMLLVDKDGKETELAKVK